MPALFNGPERAVPAATIPELFAAQAAGRADQPALEHADRTLTYGQLDHCVTVLATRMADHDVTGFAPLVMPTGSAVPIGMLAAMRYGVPFVPLDGGWPQPRLEQILAALGSELALTVPGSELPGTRTTLTVDVDELLAVDLPARYFPPPDPDDLIYGFYTSGSTGVPKCALNLHRGLRNRFAHMSRRFDARTDDVVLQLSPHVFDSSIWQLLWPLTTGSRVVVPDRTGVVDLDEILDTIERHGVTMTDFVPSVFNVLVELLLEKPGRIRRLRSVRQLLIGGEEMWPAAVQTFRRLAPHVRITNTYGPTEASIGMIFHDVSDADTETMPIGLPIDNTCAAILDEQLAPVPDGETGYLYIGGECLGKGYLGDTEKTRRAFVDNPLPGLRTKQLYRTGDLAFRRPDGRLGFRGRDDDQVKLGGLRIELGDVESVLNRHPDVVEARVVTYTDGSELTRLAGFYRARGELRSADLLTYARSELPTAMVPARLIPVGRMPLLPSGKLDRRELARRVASLATDPSNIGPDPVGQVIRELWQRLAPGGPDVDFFAAGGDSLGATKLVLAVNERLGSSLTAADLVAAPTATGMAARITAGNGGDGESHVDRARADAQLAEEIRPDGSRAEHPARNILLTGATGFVGAQLLHELLARTSATVHCLVRADDRAAAHRRLVENLTRYELPSADPNRVVAIPADLSAPGLGLDDHDHALLGFEMDAIVHAAAVVNLVLDYDHHRDANVHGTIELLRLAVLGRTKPVHFVSTLSLLDGDVNGVERPPPDQVPVKRGYELSKWVAERLLATAAEHGIPVAVYRLGEVMPHSITGIPASGSLVEMLIDASLELGVTFDSPIELDYTPVDDAGALLAMAVRQQVDGWFHVTQANRLPLNELTGLLAREFGLEPVSYRRFWQLLRHAAYTSPGLDNLVRLLAAVPAAVQPVSDTELSDALRRLFWDGGPHCRTERTDRLRAEVGLPSRRVDGDVLARYVDYHRRRTLGRVS